MIFLWIKVTTKGKGGGENYLYDQVAMDAFMKTLPENANPSIQRFKGLGTYDDVHVWYLHLMVYMCAAFTYLHLMDYPGLLKVRPLGLIFGSLELGSWCCLRVEHLHTRMSVNDFMMESSWNATSLVSVLSFFSFLPLLLILLILLILLMLLFPSSLLCFTFPPSLLYHLVIPIWTVLYGSILLCTVYFSIVLYCIYCTVQFWHY